MFTFRSEYLSQNTWHLGVKNLGKYCGGRIFRSRTSTKIPKPSFCASDF